MNKIFWNAFPSFDRMNDEALKLSLQYYQRREKTSNIRLVYTNVDCNTLAYRQGNTKPLEEFGPEWTLLIDAHGNPYKDVQHVSVGGEKATATTLKTMLYKDGLKTSHTRIRLLSCFGGGYHPFDPRYSKPGNDTYCFAKVLASQMGLVNTIDGVDVSYPNILVGGYQGATSAPAWREFGGMRVNDNFLTGTWHRNKLGDKSRYILWFNANGEHVVKDGRLFWKVELEDGLSQMGDLMGDMMANLQDLLNDPDLLNNT
jgi:hypothetical protein